MDKDKRSGEGKIWDRIPTFEGERRGRRQLGARGEEEEMGDEGEGVTLAASRVRS